MLAESDKNKYEMPETNVENLSCCFLSCHVLQV